MTSARNDTVNGALAAGVTVVVLAVFEVGPGFHSGADRMVVAVFSFVTSFCTAMIWDAVHKPRG